MSDVVAEKILSIKETIALLEAEGLSIDAQRVALFDKLAVDVEDTAVFFASNDRADFMAALDLFDIPYGKKDRKDVLGGIVHGVVYRVSKSLRFEDSSVGEGSVAVSLDPVALSSQDDEPSLVGGPIELVPDGPDEDPPGKGVSEVEAPVNAASKAAPDSSARKHSKVTKTAPKAKKPKKGANPPARQFHPVWTVTLTAVVCFALVLAGVIGIYLGRQSTRMLPLAESAAITPTETQMDAAAAAVNGVKEQGVVPTEVPAKETWVEEPVSEPEAPASQSSVEKPAVAPTKPAQKAVVSTTVPDSGSLLSELKEDLSPAELAAIETMADDDVYEITEVGAGQQIITNWDDPSKDMMVKNDLEYPVFVTVSSDPGTLNGWTCNQVRGYVAAVLLQPGETLDLTTGFNESNGHYNLWAVRYRVPQSMKIEVAAQEKLWEMQGRENKNVVAFFSGPQAEPQILYQSQ